MDLTNLKSSLFGYSKLAVTNLVSGMESDHNQKIQDLQKESVEAQESLRGQIEALRAKYEEEIQKLNEKIEELTKERDLLRRDNDTIADTLLDAKEYAEDLRNKADQKAKERDEEHLHTLEMQQNKVQEIDTKLHDVLGEISELLETATKHLTGKAEALEETGQDIEDEKAKYAPAEEAQEEAAGEALEEEAGEAIEEAVEENAEEAVAEETLEKAAEAVEEAAEETAEAVDETSDEAIEKAAEAIEEEAEETADSAVDQWKKVFDQGTSSDEAVSKFEQAAGEIAGKLQ